jgi:putative nucleotidyltransferase with HDIG domain
MADGRRRRGLARSAFLFLRDSAARRTLWVLLFCGVTLALFASVSLPSQVNLHVGEVAPVTIVAPRDLVDQAATRAARQAAAAKVAPVYTVDQGVIQQALASYDAGAQAVEAARAQLSAPSAAQASGASASSASAPASSARASASSAQSPGSGGAGRLASAASALAATLDLHLPLSDYEAVLSASPADLVSGAEAARSRLQAALAAGVLDSGQGQLAAARSALSGEIAALPLPAAVDAVFGALAMREMVPDEFVDAQATLAAQQQAEAAVPPVTVARGQVIVRQGDVVDADEIGLLEAAGLLHPGGTFGVVAGAGLLSLLLLVLSWAFLAQFQPGAIRSETPLVLFGALLTAALAALRLALPISPYLAPIAWAAIMASVAFGPGVALFVGALGGLAAGLLVHDLAVATVTVTGAWAAVFSLRRFSQRSDLLRAGLYAAGAQAAAALLLLGLILGRDDGQGAGSVLAVAAAHPVLQAAAWAAFGGVLSGVLAVGTLPLAEALGVLTPFKLLELANPGQPLLRRLMVEAPGTYHHSLMVANLAEASCQAIGADALLVRAAAYYHDVGKLKRPGFFVENQMGGENPHDKLSPQLSALIVTSHVPDGVEIAQRYRLPREIVDFIRTHHGTTLVRYFYNAARRGEADASAGRLAAAGNRPVAAVPSSVSEADFRYDGPLPETREAAVVMLADGVEAAVRALPHPSEEEIAAVIQRIMTDRLEDGQLDRAALTLRDLHEISRTFRRILVGAYHARIEYPEGIDAPGTAGGPRLEFRLPAPPPAGPGAAAGH